VCVYEGFVVESSSKRRLAPQNSLQKKRREIFFTKRGDRLIEKIAKKQGKKTRDFHSPRQTRF
jgi:hypothetical protein